MTEVTRTTADQGEMATIGQALDKTEGTRVINHQEADKIHRSSLIKIILQREKEIFGSAGITLIGCKNYWYSLVLV